jgi:hypothetical protein
MKGQATTVSTDSMMNTAIGALSRQTRGASVTRPYSQARSNHGLDPSWDNSGQAEKTNALSTNRDKGRRAPRFDGSDIEAILGSKSSILIEIADRVGRHD